MTSVGDVISVVAAGLDRVRAGRIQLIRAAELLTRAHAGLAAASTGSADARLDATKSLLTQASERLHRADTAFDEGITVTARYVTTIGGHLPPDSAAEPDERTAWPQLASSTAEQEAPAFVSRIAAELRTLLPRGTKTVGVLATMDGATRSKPIWSGEEGPGANAPGLRRDSPRRWHQSVSATQHAEGHVSAIMRRPDGPRHAVLVVSKRPCPGQLGCDRLLPELLPAGASLTVYVAGKDGGLRLWKTYLGTGEGVAT